MASLAQDALDSAALGSKKKETTVWMDGAFDVMHFGHANAFRQVQISVSYLAVPSCGGAFTSFTRVVSRNDGSGWFLF